MSASPRTRMGVVAAGLSCLMIGNAWAERETERETEREGRSAQTQESAADRATTGQIDQSTRQGQQYTAEFRGTQGAAAGQKKPVERFLAACLLAKNKAEVELGQFAQQQAQNPEVKEFAQRMVQDHQRLVQQLQPLAGAKGAHSGASTSLETSSQIDAQRQASETTRLPGSPGAGQPTPGGTAIDQNLNRNINESLTADQAGPQNAALKQLMEIDRQITERHSQAVREELQQKQGAEFDKCYVGSQVAGHMHMLSALEVIQQQGPDQLKQIAEQAQPIVQQHLEHAKQLMKQLEGSSTGSSQAERQSSRTQR